MNDLITVIIPVYNMEKYLHCCIDSVLRQSHKNLEIILVDDGSTDKSLTICEKYAADDERVKVMCKPNGGVSSARNKGLDAMSGDFFTFVDADDYIDDNYISFLFNNIKKYQADISACGFRRIYRNKVKPIGNTGKRHIKSGKDLIFTVKSPPWGKLYRSNNLKNHRFDETVHIAEDLLFNFFACWNSSKVCYEDVCLYNYRRNTTSAMYGQFSEKNFDPVKVTGYLLDFCRQNYLPLAGKMEHMHISAKYHAFLRMAMLKRGHRVEYNNEYKEYKRHLAKNIKTLCAGSPLIMKLFKVLSVYLIWGVIPIYKILLRIR